MNQRHKARRLALQGLCCLDVQGARAADLVDDFVADSREDRQVAEAARIYIREAYRQFEDLDELLARHARHWELSRLAMVDRNILRLALWELREGRTPLKVVISEALRLAKEFSTAESPRFVNGILDAVARELPGRKKEQKPPRRRRDTEKD